MISLFWVDSLVILWVASAIVVNIPFAGQSYMQKVAYRPPNSTQKNTTVSPGLPTRLSIPSLHIVATIESVGSAKDGSMGVPKRASDVAWFAPWTRPGGVGSAVIAGHLDDVKGRPAIFEHLKELKPGDLVNVSDDLGVLRTFVVRSTKEYGVDDSTDSIFAPWSSSNLNLITCSGKWNKSRQIYNKRFVVFTELIKK